MKALVTGASGGLGRAIALRLAAEEYEVWVHYSKGAEKAKEVLAEIETAGGKGRLVQCDLSSDESVDTVLAPLVSREGPIHVLINNAGITSDGYMMMLPTEKWQDVMDLNLGGFFRVTRACLKGMVGERGGRIINIGSLAGEKGNIGQVAYAASKAGLAGATRALALEMARWNILVNTVSPGPLDVGMATEVDAEKLLPMIPLGRLGRAEEVAGVVAFLCSEDASFITGQVISVNGGMGM